MESENRGPCRGPRIRFGFYSSRLRHFRRAASNHPKPMNLHLTRFVFPACLRRTKFFGFLPQAVRRVLHDHRRDRRLAARSDETREPPGAVRVICSIDCEPSAFVCATRPEQQNIAMRNATTITRLRSTRPNVTKISAHGSPCLPAGPLEKYRFHGMDSLRRSSYTESNSPVYDERSRLLRDWGARHPQLLCSRR
jgi:hypothetical protein